MSNESNSDTKPKVVEPSPAPAEPAPKAQVSSLAPALGTDSPQADEPKKKRRYRNTAFKRLDPRRQKFVMNYLQSSNALESVRKSGYQVKDPLQQKVQVQRLLNQEKVQNALQEKIREMFPNVEEHIAKELHALAVLPLKLSREDIGATVTEKLAILDKYIKIFGFEAPKKVQSLQARVNLLPKSE
jgi:hypothetical protein